MKHLSINATFCPSQASSGIHEFCLPDKARDGRNVALIDKCFMVCSIVQRRVKLLYEVRTISVCIYIKNCSTCTNHVASGTETMYVRRHMCIIMHATTQ